MSDIVAICKRCGAQVDKAPYLRYTREELVRASFGMVVERHRATCGGRILLDVREHSRAPESPAQAKFGRKG